MRSDPKPALICRCPTEDTRTKGTTLIPPFVSHTKKLHVLLKRTTITMKDVNYKDINNLYEEGVRSKRSD